jgi:hypothetical protein
MAQSVYFLDKKSFKKKIVSLLDLLEDPLFKEEYQKSEKELFGCMTEIDKELLSLSRYIS